MSIEDKQIHSYRKFLDDQSFKKTIAFYREHYGLVDQNIYDQIEEYYILHPTVETVNEHISYRNIEFPDEDLSEISEKVINIKTFSTESAIDARRAIIFNQHRSWFDSHSLKRPYTLNYDYAFLMNTNLKQQHFHEHLGSFHCTAYSGARRSHTFRRKLRSAIIVLNTMKDKTKAKLDLIYSKRYQTNGHEMSPSTFIIFKHGQPTQFIKTPDELIFGPSYLDHPIQCTLKSACLTHFFEIFEEPIEVEHNKQILIQHCTNQPTENFETENIDLGTFKSDIPSSAKIKIEGRLRQNIVDKTRKHIKDANKEYERLANILQSANVEHLLTLSSQKEIEVYHFHVKNSEEYTPSQRLNFSTKKYIDLAVKALFIKREIHNAQSANDLLNTAIEAAKTLKSSLYFANISYNNEVHKCFIVMKSDYSQSFVRSFIGQSLQSYVSALFTKWCNIQTSIITPQHFRNDDDHVNSYKQGITNFFVPSKILFDLGVTGIVYYKKPQPFKTTMNEQLEKAAKMMKNTKTIKIFDGTQWIKTTVPKSATEFFEERKTKLRHPDMQLQSDEDFEPQGFKSMANKVKKQFTPKTVSEAKAVIHEFDETAKKIGTFADSATEMIQGAMSYVRQLVPDSMEQTKCQQLGITPKQISSDIKLLTALIKVPLAWKTNMRYIEVFSLVHEMIHFLFIDNDHFDFGQISGAVISKIAGKIAKNAMVEKATEYYHTKKQKIFTDGSVPLESESEEIEELEAEDEEEFESQSFEFFKKEEGETGNHLVNIIVKIFKSVFEHLKIPNFDIVTKITDLTKKLKPLADLGNVTHNLGKLTTGIHELFDKITEWLRNLFSMKQSYSKGKKEFIKIATFLTNIELLGSENTIMRYDKTAIKVHSCYKRLAYLTNASLSRPAKRTHSLEEKLRKDIEALIKANSRKFDAAKSVIDNIVIRQETIGLHVYSKAGIGKSDFVINQLIHETGIKLNYSDLAKKNSFTFTPLTKFNETPVPELHKYFFNDDRTPKMDKSDAEDCKKFAEFVTTLLSSSPFLVEELTEKKADRWQRVSPEIYCEASNMIIPPYMAARKSEEQLCRRLIGIEVEPTIQVFTNCKKANLKPEEAERYQNVTYDDKMNQWVWDNATSKREINFGHPKSILYRFYRIHRKSENPDYQSDFIKGMKNPENFHYDRSFVDFTAQDSTSYKLMLQDIAITTRIVAEAIASKFPRELLARGYLPISFASDLISEQVKQRRNRFTLKNGIKEPGTDYLPSVQSFLKEKLQYTVDEVPEYEHFEQLNEAILASYDGENALNQFICAVHDPGLKFKLKTFFEGVIDKSFKIPKPEKNLDPEAVADEIQLSYLEKYKILKKDASDLAQKQYNFIVNDLKEKRKKIVDEVKEINEERKNGTLIKSIATKLENFKNNIISLVKKASPWLMGIATILMIGYAGVKTEKHYRMKNGAKENIYYTLNWDTIHFKNPEDCTDITQETFRNYNFETCMQILKENGYVEGVDFEAQKHYANKIADGVKKFKQRLIHGKIEQQHKGSSKGDGTIIGQKNERPFETKEERKRRQNAEMMEPSDIYRSLKYNTPEGRKNDPIGYANWNKQWNKGGKKQGGGHATAGYSYRKQSDFQYVLSDNEQQRLVNINGDKGIVFYISESDLVTIPLDDYVSLREDYQQAIEDSNRKISWSPRNNWKKLKGAYLKAIDKKLWSKEFENDLLRAIPKLRKKYENIRFEFNQLEEQFAFTMNAIETPEDSMIFINGIELSPESELFKEVFNLRLNYCAQLKYDLANYLDEREPGDNFYVINGAYVIPNSTLYKKITALLAETIAPSTIDEETQLKVIHHEFEKLKNSDGKIDEAKIATLLKKVHFEKQNAYVEAKRPDDVSDFERFERILPKLQMEDNGNEQRMKRKNLLLNQSGRFTVHAKRNGIHGFYSGSLVMIDASHFITAEHVFEAMWKGSDEVSMQIEIFLPGQLPITTYMFSIVHSDKYGEGDKAIVKLHKPVPGIKDITHMFIDTNEISRLGAGRHAELVRYQLAKGEPPVSFFTDTEILFKKNIQGNDMSHTLTNDQLTLRVNDTIKGDSGSLVIVEDKQQQVWIAGVFNGLLGRMMKCGVLTLTFKEDIEKLKSLAEVLPLKCREQIEKNPDYPGREKILEKWTDEFIEDQYMNHYFERQSCFEVIQEHVPLPEGRINERPTITDAGEFLPMRFGVTTQFKRTCFHHLEGGQFGQTHDISVKRPFVNDEGELIKPLDIAIAKYNAGHQHTYKNTDMLRKARETIIDALLGRGTQFGNGILKLPLATEPYTMDETINGNELTQKIDTTTSAGYPLSIYKKGQKKLAWLDLCDHKSPSGADKHELNPWMATQYWALLRYIQDPYTAEWDYGKKRPLLAFCLTFKDETRTKDKIKAGKTRLFAAANFLLTLMVRMFFGPAIENIKASRSSTSVVQYGVNPHSPEQWGGIKNGIFGKHKNVFTGDIKNMDGTPDKEIKEDICEIFLACVAYSVFYAEMARRVYGYIIPVTYILMDVMFELMGTLPSGHPLTTLFNCFWNWMMHLIAFEELTGIPMNLFFAYVMLCVYGDDDLVSVVDAMKDKYNAKTYSEFWKKYNVHYTNANKYGDIKPFEQPEDVNFLSRGWGKIKVGAQYMLVSQLNKDSIENSVAWSTDPTDYEKVESTLRAALYEAARWGPEYFHDFKRRLIECNNQSKIKYSIPTTSFEQFIGSNYSNDYYSAEEGDFGYGFNLIPEFVFLEEDEDLFEPQSSWQPFEDELVNEIKDNPDEQHGEPGTFEVAEIAIDNLRLNEQWKKDNIQSPMNHLADVAIHVFRRVHPNIKLSSEIKKMIARVMIQAEDRASIDDYEEQTDKHFTEHGAKQFYLFHKGLIKLDNLVRRGGVNPLIPYLQQQIPINGIRERKDGTNYWFNTYNFVARELPILKIRPDLKPPTLYYAVLAGLAYMRLIRKDQMWIEPIEFGPQYTLIKTYGVEACMDTEYIQERREQRWESMESLDELEDQALVDAFERNEARRLDTIYWETHDPAHWFYEAINQKLLEDFGVKITACQYEDPLDFVKFTEPEGWRQHCEKCLDWEYFIVTETKHSRNSRRVGFWFVSEIIAVCKHLFIRHAMASELPTWQQRFRTQNYRKKGSCFHGTCDCSILPKQLQHRGEVRARTAKRKDIIAGKMTPFELKRHSIWTNDEIDLQDVEYATMPINFINKHPLCHRRNINKMMYTLKKYKFTHDQLFDYWKLRSRSKKYEMYGDDFSYGYPMRSNAELDEISFKTKLVRRVSDSCLDEIKENIDSFVHPWIDGPMPYASYPRKSNRRRLQ